MCLWCIINRLTKTFNYIPHVLIIAKLEAYGFQIDGLRLGLVIYLSSRKQRVNF